MPNRKKNTVTGNYFQVYDREGNQITNKKKGGNKWRIEIELPQLGKKKRPRKIHTFYCSERQAKTETQNLITNYDNLIKQNHIPKNIDFIDATEITFGEYAEKWLRVNWQKRELKRRTLESYACIAKKHVIPQLGHLTLADILPIHIARYKEIKLATLSAVTVNKHLAFISDVFDDASSDEKRIIHYNPAMLVKRAKNNKKHGSAIVNCLNVIELNNLLYKLQTLYALHKLQISYSLRPTGREELRKDPEVIKKLKRLGYTDEEISSPKAMHKLKAALQPIVYLAANTGMRLSEMLSLRWKDIDFAQKIIKVYSSSHFGIKSEGEESAHHVNSTKEGKPKAYIDITDQDVEFLKRYRKDQPEQKMRYRSEYKDSDLVFARKNGTSLRNDTVSKEFTKFAKSIGYNITFHGLRHTHCTLLLAEGIPAMYVARRVGHQSPNTTNNTYSHVEKGDGIKIGEVFQKILSKAEDFSSEKLLEAEHEATKISGLHEIATNLPQAQGIEQNVKK